jgi:hypothetical protein
VKTATRRYGVTDGVERDRVLTNFAIRLSGKVSPANVRRIHLQQPRVIARPAFPGSIVNRGDVEALPGGNTLAELKSVSQISQAKGDYPLPENEPFTLPPTQIRQIGKGRPVREMK